MYERVVVAVCSCSMGVRCGVAAGCCGVLLQCVIAGRVTCMLLGKVCTLAVVAECSCSMALQCVVAVCCCGTCDVYVAGEGVCVCVSSCCSVKLQHGVAVSIAVCCCSAMLQDV